MADLDTGAETPLIEIPFGVNSDIGLHFSGNCAEEPGRVLVSTYGAENPPTGESHSWMDTQLFMLELKQNPTVWRIAHTHAYTAEDYSGEKNYFAEAFATINKAGSRIYFGSNWGNFAVDYTDTYQIALPPEWAFDIPEFPSSPIILLFLTATLTAMAVYYKKHLKKQSCLRVSGILEPHEREHNHDCENHE
jgi:hypothetical protein